MVRNMSVSMKIVVAGGTGFIGRQLCQSLALHGHHVTVLSRSPAQARPNVVPAVTLVEWGGATRGPWERTLVGADALINLSGEPIAEGRWTATRKQALRESRIGTTRLLIQTLSRLSSKPRSRSEEHTSELQSRLHLVCRLLLEKKKNINTLNKTQLTT